MEKPSVTFRHDTAYLVGGFMLLMTVVSIALSYVVPADQQSRQVSLVVVVALIAFCLVCFLWGGSAETLDDNGIFIKRPFRSKRYPWCDVTKVSVEVVQQYRGKGPELCLLIRNRKLPLHLAYTKRSLACISCYYGQPDQDKWGKPPTFI